MAGCGVLDDADTSARPVVIAGDFNTRGLNEPFEELGCLWLTRNLRDTSGWWELDHKGEDKFVLPVRS